MWTIEWAISTDSLKSSQKQRIKLKDYLVLITTKINTAMMSNNVENSEIYISYLGNIKKLMNVTTKF